MHPIPYLNTWVAHPITTDIIFVFGAIFKLENPTNARDNTVWTTVEQKVVFNIIPECQIAQHSNQHKS